mgnify:CR=1 FL=1
MGDGLAKNQMPARTVTIKVRYDDFTTITRSQSAPQSTADEQAIVDRALALLAKTDAGRRPIRLLGVSVHNFGDVVPPAEDLDGRLPFDYAE